MEIHGHMGNEDPPWGVIINNLYNYK
jgi:hypothetical protein